MDPNASFSSPHSRYQTERCRTHPHFPNPTDKAACARFRLARRRRASAQAAPALPQSPPAADSVELWRQILSLHENFNELSSLVLKQGRIIDGLLQLHVSAAPLPLLPTQQEDRGLDPSPTPQHLSGDVIDDITRPPVLVTPLPSAASPAPLPDSMPSSSRASEFHSPSYPRSMRSGEDIVPALPKLRGMFNRKRLTLPS
ncbi:hypothetical protein B0H12DRAFT_1151142 [Mycena haematopus]|nr:hypothetical protein B0H12DRAFT_1151142 [Mycena haematopus]